MPRRARTTCKVEGCTQPLHFHPSGTHKGYCREHMHLGHHSGKHGLPSFSAEMGKVLRTLRAAHESDVGYLFAALDVPKTVDRRTIRALMERDWIVRSEGLDGTRYKITGRGVKALMTYETPNNRRDGICPRCCERPRHTTRNGRRDAYCLECSRGISARKAALGIAKVNADRLCSRCHKRPLHQYPNGKYSTYCKHCGTVTRRMNHRKQKRREFKAVKAGGPVSLCKICRERPCRVYPNCMSDQCAECLKAAQARHRAREKRAKLAAKLETRGG